MFDLSFDVDIDPIFSDDSDFSDLSDNEIDMFQNQIDKHLDEVDDVLGCAENVNDLVN